ncbi:MAG: amidohydrolase family protein, partial [Sphingomicrobium sp.]
MKTRLLIALAVAALSAPFPALADTLIDNVAGLQVDASGQLQRFNGLLVGDDGKVVQLLRAGDPRPRRVDFRVDQRGLAMLPGLIDAHGHVGDFGIGTLQLDLSGTRSIAELQQRLAAFAASNSAPRWIIGRGWNQELWAEKRFPTTADVDAIVADRPVWLVRVDEHAAVGNSAALREAGYSAATRLPPGSRAEHGLFFDQARDLIEAKIPPPLPAQRDQGLANAQRALLGFGLTSVTDMRTTAADWDAIRRMGDAGRLQVRMISYAADLETLLAVAGSRPTPWLYGDRLRMIGLKIYADGALGSRGAWLKTPYSDKPGTRGLQFLDDAKLRNLASRAAMDHFQVAVHAI